MREPGYICEHRVGRQGEGERTECIFGKSEAFDPGLRVFWKEGEESFEDL